MLEGLRIIRSLREDLVQSALPRIVLDEILFLLGHKEEDFTNVAGLALGMAFEVLADDDRVVPGDTLGVNLALLNRSFMTVNVTSLDLDVPPGWTAAAGPAGAEPSSDIGYNESVERKWQVFVPSDARLTRPYWYRGSLNDPRVEVEDESLIGLPWSSQPVAGRAGFVVDGVEIEIRQPVQHRFADRAFGEIRRELQVVPALSVTLRAASVSRRRGTRPALAIQRSRTQQCEQGD